MVSAGEGVEVYRRRTKPPWCRAAAGAAETRGTRRASGWHEEDEPSLTERLHEPRRQHKNGDKTPIVPYSTWTRGTTRRGTSRSWWGCREERGSGRRKEGDGRGTEGPHC